MRKSDEQADTGQGLISERQFRPVWRPQWPLYSRAARVARLARWPLIQPIRDERATNPEMPIGGKRGHSSGGLSARALGGRQWPAQSANGARFGVM